jgi:CRISPR/Cas system CSM-associated protein Csm3 (group 7 of RAMP superfamily)
MVKLRVEMSFLLNSGFHTSADRALLGVDKTTYLKTGGIKSAAIPATLLKGVIREQAGRVLKSFGVDVCQSPRPGDICGGCLICELFGWARQKSKLRFEEAEIEDSVIDVKMCVGIDRKRKVAKEDHLFSQEISWGRRFTSTVKGFFPSKKDALKGCSLLFIGASFFALGSGKSRGQGWLKLSRFNAFIDDIEVAEEEIDQVVREVLGL